MSVDLLLRNATLPDGRQVDIGIDAGTFVAMEPRLSMEGRRELDLAGQLVLPGLVDVHHHLDKANTFEILGSGTDLLSSIRLMAEYKPKMTAEEVYGRAHNLVERVMRHGVCAIRTHVDLVGEIGLQGLEAVLRLREEYADRIRIQAILLPPPDFNFADPQDASLMQRALAMGPDGIGGVPSLSRQPATYIDHVLRIAREHGCLVDMHVDESSLPDAVPLEYLAKATIREGLTGRVTAGHCCTLSVVEDEVADRVIRMVSQARINIVTCPITNLYLEGGGGRVPGFRGLTRVRDLMRAGVNVCCASDNVFDAFNPYGNGDPILAALIAGLGSCMGSRSEQEALIGTITSAGAKAMCLEGYGLAPGCRADLLAVPSTFTRVLADQPGRRTVVLNGRLVD